MRNCEDKRDLYLYIHSKLWSHSRIEFEVSDVIPANAQNISPLVFLAYFC